MNGSNRRDFLKVAGAGAAAVGISGVVSGTATAAAAPAPTAVHKLPAGAEGSLVAYIDDVAAGEISVMVHGRQVTVTDHATVAKLATLIHAAESATSV